MTMSVFNILLGKGGVEDDVDCGRDPAEGVDCGEDPAEDVECGEAPEEDVPDESGIGVHDGALS